MDEEKPRKTTPFSRSARNRRIVERLREGFGFDEIAREEKLSGRRVRQIVKQGITGTVYSIPIWPILPPARPHAPLSPLAGEDPVERR